MNRKISILLLVLISISFTNCSNRKKGALLLPFLGLGDGANSQGTTTPGDGSFTVIDLEETDPGQVTTPTPAPTTTTSETATTVVEQTTPTGDFTFETNITVPVTVVVTNENGPVVGAPVTVTETATTGDTNILGQGNTGNNGSVTIEVSVPPTVPSVNISIVGINPSTGQAEEITGSAPIQQPSSNNDGAPSEGTVVVSPTVNVGTTNFSPPTGCLTNLDTDCDGIANHFDEYPEDPTLAFVTRSGRNTIAFEDLYPSAGDADLNDHSTIFSTEMDRTPNNFVKQIRGTYTHVAKGAGYNHELRLSLDVPTTATVQVNYLDGSGNPWNGCAGAPKYTANTAGDCTGGELTSDQLKRGVLLLPSSDKTLFGAKNAPKPGEEFTINNFVRGVTAQVTITFTEPVNLSQGKNLVGGHLNYFLAINQKTNGVFRQIYRPGYFTDDKGEDLYLDKNKFPWAIIVPGIFNHQTEGSDIRRPSSSGYIFFNAWMNSKGVAHKDWYDHMDMIPAPNRPSYVVRVRDFYTDNGFSAYLIKAVQKNTWEVSGGLILIGAVLGFLFKRKSTSK